MYAQKSNLCQTKCLNQRFAKVRILKLTGFLSYAQDVQ